MTRENPLMLGIDREGGRYVVRYWTANGEVIEGRAGGVSDALLAVASEVSGFPVKIHYPEEMGGPSEPTELSGIDVKIVNDQVSQKVGSDE